MKGMWSEDIVEVRGHGTLWAVELEEDIDGEKGIV